MASNRSTQQTRGSRHASRKSSGEGRAAGPTAKETEDRYRLVVEAAPIALVAINREGTIQLVNAQTEKLFGYSREELLGQPVEILVPQRFRTNHPGHRTGFFGDPRSRMMGLGRD